MSRPTSIAGAAALSIASGAFGQINWIQQSAAPADDNLLGVFFLTPEHGFITGKDKLFMETTDGGESWRQISRGAATVLKDILMLPSGVGIAVGDRGVILRTADFGRRWVVLPQIEDGAVDFETVKAVDQDTIVAAGNGFYRSDDAGLTWSRPGPLPGVAKDLSFLDENNGWAFGSVGGQDSSIVRTTDGGASWVRLLPGRNTPPAQEGRVMPSDRGWALYPQTAQAITNDGFEQSFIIRKLPGGDSWNEFGYADDQTGWYGGFFGGLLKTTDGGFTWQEQTLPGFREGGGQADRLTDIVVRSPQEAHAGTRRPGALVSGIVYRTLNGGASWTALNPIRSATNQIGGAVSEMDVLPTGEIWTMAANGFIFASDEPVVSTPGDVNGDGVVDFADLLTLLENWS